MEIDPFTTQIDLGGMWHFILFGGLTVAVLKWLWSLPGSNFNPAKLLGAYVLVYSLYLIECPLLHFGPYTTRYQASAGQTFIEALFIPLLALMGFKWITRLIPFAVLFACISVWFNIPGFLNAPSFNSAFAALALPMVSAPLAAFILLTVFFHHGSTALFMVGAQLIILGLKEPKARKYVAIAVPCILGLTYIHHHGPWLDGLERLQRWHHYMEFWAKEPRWVLFGVGPGTFLWTAAMLDGFKAPLFLQMHSDWLQILFEYGVVGLALAAGVFIQAVKRSWDYPKLLASLFGCAVFGLTYHPIRYFPSALLTAWIFIQGLSVVKEIDFKFAR